MKQIMKKNTIIALILIAIVFGLFSINMMLGIASAVILCPIAAKRLDNDTEENL